MTSAHPLLLDDITYISLTIPILFFFAYVPYWIQGLLTMRYRKTFDNANPQLFFSMIKDEAKKGDKDAETIVRCRSCHKNCLEDMIIWTIAVVIAYLFQVNRTLMLILTSFHLGGRIVYIPLYIFISNKKASILRSLVWMFAWVSQMLILFISIIRYHVINDETIA